jgi:lipopolysaccharide transport system permease protein
MAVARSERELVIQPTKGWRFLDWREFWAYRDLLNLLIWRDISSRYKQTILGPAWFVVQPVVTTIMFTLVFGRMAHISTDGVPPMLFYLSGLLAWGYFAQNFTSTSSTLTNNVTLFGKVYFPRLIVPLSGILSNLVPFIIQLGTFGALYAWFKWRGIGAGFGFTMLAWLLPLTVLQVAAISLGVGLWVAALTTRFRDFSILAGFLLQLWLYATPVIYPLARVPQKWRLLVALNPMTMPTENVRQMLLGVGSGSWRLEMISIVVSLLTLLTGVLAFQRVEKNFVDVL